MRCDGRGPAHSSVASLCAAGMDALVAPAGEDAPHAERDTPVPSGILTKEPKTPFCRHHCAQAVGFVRVAGVNGFWFLVILS